MQEGRGNGAAKEVTGRWYTQAFLCTVGRIMEMTTEHENVWVRHSVNGHCKCKQIPSKVTRPTEII